MTDVSNSDSSLSVFCAADSSSTVARDSSIVAPGALRDCRVEGGRRGETRGHDQSDGEGGERAVGMIKGLGRETGPCSREGRWTGGGRVGTGRGC